MAPEEKRDDDIFEVEDVDDAPPPQEFQRPKWLMDLEKKKQKEGGETPEVKSGAAGGKPPPLTPTNAAAPVKPAPPARAAPAPAHAPRPAPVPTPTPANADVRFEKPTPPGPAPNLLDALSKALDQAEIRKQQMTPGNIPKMDPTAALEQAEIRKHQGVPQNLPKIQDPSAELEQAEIRQHKGEAAPNLAKFEPVGEFDVKIDQSKGVVRPSLRPLEGPVEILKPAHEAKPVPAPTSVTVPGDYQVVQDIHAKHPRSERLKVSKPRKIIGVVDTTFARFNMGDAAEDELRQLAGEYDVVRRTVPGIKDLAVECKILLEEEDADLVVACGMVGGQPIDKQCAHEASMAIQWAMLSTNRHILEVFVHEDEASDEAQLAWLMERRTREHAINAHWMVQEPDKLRQQAGMGLRQGFDDAGPIRPKS